MHKTLFLSLIFFVIFELRADNLHILFIGNSYTATGNLPGTLASLASSNGDTLFYDSNTPGGYTLQGHSANTTSLNKINSRNWHYVVLQEQSQRPSFPPSQVAVEVYPYAALLNAAIKNNYACTETVFYMTWGRQNGDATNCPFWPPVCTYEGMQQRLRESYLQMGIDNEATVSPVGMAWKHLRDSTGTINLYNPDGSHPSTRGVYLTACVFYATLFQKSPIGLTYHHSLPAGEIAILQYIAHHTVFDSTGLWRINANWKPQNIHTSNITLNSATLNWNPVANAHHYNIRGRQLGGANWTELKVTGAVNQKHVFGLSGNTSYEWQVIAHCDSAEHLGFAWSDLDTFSVECPATSATWTGTVSTNGASLNWASPNLNVSGFEIKGKRIGATQWTTLLVPGTSNFKVVYGLQPASGYHWTIRSWCDVNGSYVSEWAELDTFFTNAVSARLAENVSQYPRFNSEPSTLDVFPNPARGRMVVSSNMRGPVQLKVWTVAGALISKTNYSTGETELEMEDWPAGVYIVEMNTREKFALKKVVIE